MFTREISSWTLEEKFHIYQHPCITLYLLFFYLLFGDYIFFLYTTLCLTASLKNSVPEQIRVDLNKYALSVYRSGQLIHSDPEDYNLVYVNRGNGAEAVAHFKMAPTHARYYGFGEKAGATLDKHRVPKQHFYGQYAGGTEKIGAAMTFFNFDNFAYNAPNLTP